MGQWHRSPVLSVVPVAISGPAWPVVGAEAATVLVPVPFQRALELRGVLDLFLRPVNEDLSVVVVVVDVAGRGITGTGSLTSDAT